MLRIANFFWQLCLLRSSPAQLPPSWFMTASVFVIYLIIALTNVALTRPDLTGTAIVALVAIGIAVQASVTGALLQFKGYASRFSATWSALLGANAVMLIILLPFNIILLQSDTDNPTTLTIFADSAIWVCLGWWLAIAGYIYHKAVDISVLQGSCIAFLIELVGLVTAVNLIARL